MITNPLLEEVYRTQKRLVEEANYDMNQYTKNAQAMVLEIQKKYGLKLKYGSIKTQASVGCVSCLKNLEKINPL
jgi:hypothetical protein